MRQPRLAANYSLPLLALLRDDPSLVTVVKVSEFDRAEYIGDYSLLRQQGQTLLLHGLAQAVNPGVPEFGDTFRGSLLTDAIATTSPPYLSVHLEWRTGRGGWPNPAQFLDAFVPQVNGLRELTGLAVHLENVFSYSDGSGIYRNPGYIADPEFIAEALDRTGAGFLLDVGHARVAAWHRGVDAREYLESLPLDRVVEIHAAGPVMVDRQLRDRHGQLSEEDYQLLKLAIEKADPATVTLEYGGVGPLFESRSDPEALLQQLLRLKEIISAG